MRRTPFERAIDKFTIGDGCWEWTAATFRGYGQMGGIGRSTLKAHRVVYEQFRGPIPAGLDLDHLCRNRACVRPSHLEPVTRRENLLRGETFLARNVAKVACLHGHPFDQRNTGRTHNGTRRYCRTCLRNRAQIRRHHILSEVAARANAAAAT